MWKIYGRTTTDGGLSHYFCSLKKKSIFNLQVLILNLTRYVSEIICIIESWYAPIIVQILFSYIEFCIELFGESYLRTKVYKYT